MMRCENVILKSLPFGFTSLKSKAQVLQFRDSDVYEEYKTPVGGSVDIICSSTFQKITVDEVDSDPTDMKMTVMCLPTTKYDIPRENFPKVRKILKSFFHGNSINAIILFRKKESLNFVIHAKRSLALNRY